MRYFALDWEKLAELLSRPIDGEEDRQDLEEELLETGVIKDIVTLPVAFRAVARRAKHDVVGNIR